MEMDYIGNLEFTEKPEVSVLLEYAVESLMRVILIKFGEVHKFKLLCESKICRNLTLV